MKHQRYVHLTLTSVVFEYKYIYNPNFTKRKFNFNKCCIWIFYLHLPYDLARQFNFNKCCIWMKIEGFAGGGNLNLTLTSVVFESVYEKIFSEFCLYYLTLTSVVFESDRFISFSNGSTLFNFNKCCIWIQIATQEIFGEF